MKIQREESWGYDRRVLDYIQHASATGLYEIRVTARQGAAAFWGLHRGRGAG